jgi:ectoine hydroxylase-related dioxygenase (phytanoyl-CoA dioxygenase family)
MSSLQREGFEIIPKFVPARTILDLGRSLETVSATKSRAGMRNALRLPAVHDLAKDEKLVTLARHALGNGAIPFRATLFDKSPQSNWLVAWHQDTVLPLQERKDAPGWGPWSVKEGVTCAHAPASALEQVLAIRVHLDDSVEENGPLRVLPGSHTTGVLSDDAIHDLSIKTPAVGCYVSSGGILLMSPLTVHASSKAKSKNVRRRVLHIEYAASLEISNELELKICL